MRITSNYDDKIVAEDYKSVGDLEDLLLRHYMGRIGKNEGKEIEVTFNTSEHDQFKKDLKVQLDKFGLVEKSNPVNDFKLTHVYPINGGVLKVKVEDDGNT